ncbi:MAG TPA: adenylate/guanylate cyclase domain-containing protein, partial [Gaiellaceae bacterium]|nr:adenylate/guanylate cyclase domain-containing protein [Gaiellaceae bacterium]
MAVCPSCSRENPDGFRFCGSCGAPLAAPAAGGAGVRKTVTVLFCDVTGSTALGESVDPEALRGLLARYFARMKAIVERHGGSVEKFIGDAVMAVFGVPLAHEDDALRAVRAAAEMRDALPELGVRARIGVNTGEVVAGTEERLATGDAVNVAARLEQAAAPGEVLLGESTVRLLRDSVRVDEMPPLDAKGKTEPLAAYRLVDVSDARPHRDGTPLAGRDAQLRRLEDAFAQVTAEGTSRLVTVIGEAGVGKSRLASELVQRTGARVVRGTCLSYGEGITYWPVVEVVK